MPIFRKKKVQRLKTLYFTGKEGLEPPVPAPKTRALTTWLLPNLQHTLSKKVGYVKTLLEKFQIILLLLHYIAQ